jgi:Tol biopolymer transport system component
VNFGKKASDLDGNGDGKSDLMWQNVDGRISLWMIDGTNVTSTQNLGPYANWSVFDNKHDFNGDGKTDLLWKNTDGTASIWLMDGVNTTALQNLGPYEGWTVT